MGEPNWQSAGEIGVFAGLLAGLGRAARWLRKERMGWRRWSLRVVSSEAVMAVFCGFVGAGLAEAMGFGEYAGYATIALLAYFGPEFIEDLVLRFRDRELPKGGRLDSHDSTPPQE